MKDRLYTWLSGMMLGLSLIMIASLLGFILYMGLGAFWPRPLWQVEDGTGKVYLGVVQGREYMRDVGRGTWDVGSGFTRTFYRIADREFYGTDFVWLNDHEVIRRTKPKDAVVVERLEWGPFFGFIRGIETPEAKISDENRLLPQLHEEMRAARARAKKIRHIERHVIGKLNDAMERERLALRRNELRYGLGAQGMERVRAAHEEAMRRLEERYGKIAEELTVLRSQDEAYRVTLATVEGFKKELPISSIVRVHAPNSLSWFGRLGVYASRLKEFIFDEPREANSEGGVAPAIFGTVLMTLMMAVAVVPFGVLTALYLNEYAHKGPLVSAVRIAVNNLAGVPSIVFGVFGLGFFCYLVGGTLDRLLFAERLPTPTFGGGGILWASFTLALLTVPVVIVATEEALVAVPRSYREASLACGATRFQTIWRVVLPSALPGILTGMILAMARGAGEVAPLMITGVVKLAPELPFDLNFPFFHLERRFMHLGFHIYDVGFQSPNVEASKPMVFMTALLLVGIVLMLNWAAIVIRARLRTRFQGAQI
ncbi:MAG: phosphate ABC transporter permease PstA [Candidatus Omnitrophica bacterium]|nr:phosphate ABC transporter permease PstA [Candidatus Omnitrophota bacterium]